jgi:Ig-like domain CHU_C associated/Beta-propeller repeat
MKKTIALLICISSLVLMRAQVPVFQWAKRIGGSGFDAARSLVVDDVSGNIYTTGSFQGTVDFDPGAGTFNLTSAGNNDVFILKLDASGNFLWAKNIGGASDENGSYIDLDASGNLYVVGSFGSIVDFDPNGGVVNLTSAGSDDAYVLKLDASGTFLWAKSVGGTGAENATSVSIDAFGNVCVIGDFAVTGDFDPGSGVANLTSVGSNDAFILKLDASGNYMWAKRFGDIGYDSGRSITTDASGNVYATGAFQGIADFDPGAGTFNLTSAGNNDIFVLKLDASGNYVWAKNMGGTSYDSGASILTDGSGNVYTIGDLQGTGDFDPGAGTANLTAISNDVFLSKLDASGNYVWAKSWGGSALDYGISITMDLANNLYATGYFFGTVDFDPGAGSSNLVSYGGYDAYISKLDPSGNFVWAKQLGGTANDYGFSIKVDASSDSIYTAGFFNNTADFDPGISTFNLTSVSAADAFVHKMRVCTVPLAPTNVTPIANQIICANSTASLNATGVGTLSWYATATSTTALGTGTAYITPTLSTGTYTYYAEALTCSTGSVRTPVTVTVSAGPTVTINSSTICLGQQTATLIANGASTYTWMPSGSLSASTGSIVMATPNINQTYTVISTSASGCINTSTTIVTVQQLPIVTANTPSICVGQQTATLTHGHHLLA